MSDINYAEKAVASLKKGMFTKDEVADRALLLYKQDNNLFEFRGNLYSMEDYDKTVAKRYDTWSMILLTIGLLSLLGMFIMAITHVLIHHQRLDWLLVPIFLVIIISLTLTSSVDEVALRGKNVVMTVDEAKQRIGVDAG